MTLYSPKLRALWALTPLLLPGLALAQDAAATEQKNALADMFEHAGPIGWVIVIVSVLSLTLIIENFINLKRDKLAPPDLIDELAALFDSKNFQEALEVCEHERTYLSNVVLAGFGQHAHPYAPPPPSVTAWPAL